jgi:hypothetical protein
MGIVTGSHTIINKNPQLSVCIESATLKLISGLNYLPHVVIFHFLFRNKNNVRIHPSKAPIHLAPKLPEPILFWKWLHPLYFSIRIGQYFVLFKNVLET